MIGGTAVAVLVVMQGWMVFTFILLLLAIAFPD